MLGKISELFGHESFHKPCDSLPVLRSPRLAPEDAGDLLPALPIVLHQRVQHHAVFEPVDVVGQEGVVFDQVVIEAPLLPLAVASKRRALRQKLLQVRDVCDFFVLSSNSLNADIGTQITADGRR